jgi:hypothetical protein
LLFASTRLGPFLVSTTSPGFSVSMFLCPVGVDTFVPAIKHQMRVCCGPRSRSGFSAVNPRIVLTPPAQLYISMSRSLLL